MTAVLSVCIFKKTSKLPFLVLKIEESKQHFQHIMLYYFKKVKNTIETPKKICAVYGEGAVTDQMCQVA